MGGGVLWMSFRAVLELGCCLRVGSLEAESAMEILVPTVNEGPLSGEGRVRKAGLDGEVAPQGCGPTWRSASHRGAGTWLVPQS